MINSIVQRCFHTQHSIVVWMVTWHLLKTVAQGYKFLLPQNHRNESKVPRLYCSQRGWKFEEGSFCHHFLHFQFFFFYHPRKVRSSKIPPNIHQNNLDTEIRHTVSQGPRKHFSRIPRNKNLVVEKLCAKGNVKQIFCTKQMIWLNVGTKWYQNVPSCDHNGMLEFLAVKPGYKSYSTLSSQTTMRSSPKRICFTWWKNMWSWTMVSRISSSA